MRIQSIYTHTNYTMYAYSQKYILMRLHMSQNIINLRDNNVKISKTVSDFGSWIYEQS